MDFQICGNFLFYNFFGDENVNRMLRYFYRHAKLVRSVQILIMRYGQPDIIIENLYFYNFDKNYFSEGKL